MRILILTATLVVTLTFINVLKFPPMTSAFASDQSSLMFTECREDYKSYQCFVLFKFGVYPSEPFIDMRGSPFAEILPKMDEPVKETPTRKPQSRASLPEGPKHD